MAKHITYKNLMLTLAFITVAIWAYNLGTINIMLVNNSPMSEEMEN